MSSATSVGIQTSEADVVIPPPTPVNPLPSLPIALRLDNREQFLNVLVSEKTKGKRQLLVFEDDNLRTLLLRQVLNDPQASVNNQKQTKKNWENINSFSWNKLGDMAKSIAGTRLLHRSPSRTSLSKRFIRSQGGRGGDGNTVTSTDASATEVSVRNPFDTDESDVDLLGETLPQGQHIDVIIYFLRPWSIETTQALATKLNRWKQQGGIQHRLIYLPQPTAMIHQVLEDSKLLLASRSSNNSSVSVEALQLDLFPLESDVWSLEIPTAMTEILEGTPSNLIQTCARTMLKLQDLTGPLSRIQSFGPLAEDVLNKTLHLSVDEYLHNDSNDSQEGGSSTTKNPADSKVACILMDRQVDIVTPLLTTLTYEGLLDHVVGIETGFVHLPQSYLSPEESNASASSDNTSSNTKVALGVHGGDSLYAEVRDQHVEQFGTFLQNQAKALQASHQNFTSVGARKDLREIHQFVKQIPMFTQNLRSLTNHIHLAEKIKAHTEHYDFREQWQTERSLIEGETAYDTLEEWICAHHPIEKVLRGLCLQSLCSGGLKGNRYDQLRQLIVHGYGYEYLLMLHDLEKLGWIRRRDTFFESATFQSLRKSLILVNAEVDTTNPDDIAYVSSGYAPLTIRLIQAAMQGWTKSRSEVWKDLPGRLLDIEPKWPPEELSTLLQQQRPMPSLGALSNHDSSDKGKPTLIVFFIGGISYMEIASLRFLSKRPKFPYHIIMITTRVVNGITMLQQTI